MYEKYLQSQFAYFTLNFLTKHSQKVSDKKGDIWLKGIYCHDQKNKNNFILHYKHVHFCQSKLNYPVTIHSSLCFTLLLLPYPVSGPYWGVSGPWHIQWWGDREPRTQGHSPPCWSLKTDQVVCLKKDLNFTKIKTLQFLKMIACEYEKEATA